MQRAGFEMSNASGNTAGIQVHTTGGCAWGTCRLVGNQFPSPQLLAANPSGTLNFQMDLVPVRRRRSPSSAST